MLNPDHDDMLNRMDGAFEARAANEDGERPDTAAIQARLAAVTPGHWEAEFEGDHAEPFWIVYCYAPPPGPLWICKLQDWGGGERENGKADASFIAHAPADIAALLGYVARLEAENAALKAERAANELRDALHDEPQGYERYLENLRRAMTAFTPEQDAAIRAMIERGDTLGAQRAILDGLKGDEP